MGNMGDRLKEMLIEYIKDNSSNMSYEVLSEMALIYSTKVVSAYRGMFFAHFYERFLRDLPYLSDEIFYKILWSCVKSENIKIHAVSNDWALVKDII